MPRHFFSLFAGAATVALPLYYAPVANAQPSEVQAGSPAGEKVRLIYRGYEGCPDAAAFRAAVAGRVASDWEASPGELARRIDVVVARSADAYVATIELLDAEGHRLRRAVRGRDCGDVVNGIALVTALAIESRIDEAFERSEPTTATASNAEPSAASPPPPANLEPPQASAPAAPAAAPAAVVAESSPASGAASEQGSASEQGAASEQGSASEGASVPLHWRAGVRGGFVSGIAPRLAPGFGIAGLLERDALRLGLSFFGFSSGRVVAAGVEARFDLLTARLDGCPVALELGASLALEPCVTFEGGVLSGRGYSNPPAVAEGQSGSSPWLAPGALARLVASFGQLVVELEGAARFPLNREEFYVHSEGDGGAQAVDTRVHEVPAISFGAAVGVGLRL